MTIKIGVLLPTSTPDPGQPILGDVRASSRLAEEMGLDSVWSTDHLVASAPMLDSTVVLATALDTDPGKAATQLSAYAAAGTERVILAPSGTSWQHDYEFAGNLQAEL